MFSKRRDVVEVAGGPSVRSGPVGSRLGTARSFLCLVSEQPRPPSLPFLLTFLVN